MKAKETEGERGIGQYVNERGEMKYSVRERLCRKERQKVTCTPSGDVTDQHIPVFVCMSVCLVGDLVNDGLLSVCVWLFCRCNSEYVFLIKSRHYLLNIKISI